MTSIDLPLIPLVCTLVGGINSLLQTRSSRTATTRQANPRFFLLSRLSTPTTMSVTIRTMLRMWGALWIQLLQDLMKQMQI